MQREESAKAGTQPKQLRYYNPTNEKARKPTLSTGFIVFVRAFLHKFSGSRTYKCRRSSITLIDGILVRRRSVIEYDFSPEQNRAQSVCEIQIPPKSGRHVQFISSQFNVRTSDVSTACL